MGAGKYGEHIDFVPGRYAGDDVRRTGNDQLAGTGNPSGPLKMGHYAQAPHATQDRLVHSIGGCRVAFRDVISPATTGTVHGFGLRAIVEF